jgi:general secretion pathway protein G
MAQGFTLVEILIVVVILGILAAIVIPQFTSASESAKTSSLKTQLQTIRSQLELYQVQHQSDYPLLATEMWGNLTGTTNQDGDLAGTDFGPYLQKAPANPFENNSTTVAAAAAAGVGWVYNEDTGAIQAVMSTTKATELGLETDADIALY